MTGALHTSHVDARVLDRLAAITANVKRRTVAALGLRSGHRVLDVGCGPGHDTIAMACVVGPTGLVLGVDRDPEMIREASERARAAGVAAWVRHQVADAAALPWPRDAFDGCRSERLLQHLPDPRPAIAEMVRVVRPGARVAVADADWHTLSIDHPDVDLERRVVRGLAGVVANGAAGRQLRGLLADHQLALVTSEIHPLAWTDYDDFRAMSLSVSDVARRVVDGGSVTRPEFDRFLTDLDSMARTGRFFASGNMILMVGQKGGPPESDGPEDGHP